jgi:hypothetical protein
MPLAGVAEQLGWHVCQNQCIIKFVRPLRRSAADVVTIRFADVDLDRDLNSAQVIDGSDFAHPLRIEGGLTVGIQQFSGQVCRERVGRIALGRVYVANAAIAPAGNQIGVVGRVGRVQDCGAQVRFQGQDFGGNAAAHAVAEHPNPLRVCLCQGGDSPEQVHDIHYKPGVEQAWAGIRAAPAAIIGRDGQVAVLVERFGDTVSTVTGAIFGAIIVAMIKNDDGKGASARRDLQDAGDGQAVTGVCNRVAGKGVGDEQRRADLNFPGGIVAFAQSGDGVGKDDLTQRRWVGDDCRDAGRSGWRHDLNTGRRQVNCRRGGGLAGDNEKEKGKQEKGVGFQSLKRMEAMAHSKSSI